jgi:hypothetical protein
LRPGDNLFTNSVVSWDPDTGKMGVLATISVRRIKFAMASGCPYKAIFATAHRVLCAAIDTA